MEPFTQKSRALAALLVGLLSFAALGTGIGIASANAGTDSAELDSFGVPSIHHGDFARYKINPSEEFNYGASVSEGDELFHSFTWLEQTEKRDRYGNVVSVNPVDVRSYLYDHSGWDIPYFDGDGFAEETHHWSTNNDTRYYAPGGDKLVATGSSEVADDVNDGIVITLPGNITQPVPLFRGELNSSFEFSWLQDWEVRDCLIRNPFQGTEIAIGELAQHRNNCMMPRIFGGTYLESALRFEGLEEVNGVQTAQFGAWTMNSLDWYNSEGPRGKYIFNFVPDVPYPIKVSGPAIQVDWEAEKSVILQLELEMVEFVGGGQLLSQVPHEVDPDPAPEFQYAPRQPWGLDDSDVEHAFKTSEAWAVALNEPDSGLADFVEKYPDAYAYHTDYDVDQDGERRTHEWVVLVAGDDDRMSFSATRTMSHYVEGVGWLLIEDDAGPDRYGWSQYYDPPTLLADELPTAKSVLSRWHAYLSEDFDTTHGAWQLDSRRYNSDCRCYELGIEASASFVDFFSYGNVERPTEIMSFDYDLAFASFLQNGEAEMVYEVVFDYSYGANLSAAGQGEAPAGGVDSAGSSGRDGFFALPTAEQAAGAGLLAAFIGVLYWLWPVIKTAPMALFSRLEAPRALEHPVRARIAETVTDEPGIHFQELRRRLDLANGTAVHHLRTLVRAGHLQEEKASGYTCYFPRGIQQGGRIQATALRANGARRIVEAVAANPGITQKELVEIVGLAPATVNYHTKKLRDAGVVDGRRVAGGMALFASAA